MEAEVFEKYTISSGRIELEARALGAGSDVCVIVAGGNRRHIGAMGCAIAGDVQFSRDLPAHRDRAIVDIFLRELGPRVDGTVLVSAGVHLDDITAEEIRTILELSATLAREVAGKSALFAGYEKEMP